MGLIALASIKGSPGVTTTAVALASVWPGTERVLVAEVDPCGGDLAARFSRPLEPGLISLAAASRRSTGAALLLEHCQQILGELDVLLGPARSDRAEAALRVLGERGLWRELGNSEEQVLADCGRLDAQSAAVAVVEASALLLLVARPVLSELQHVHARLPSLRRVGQRVALLLVGNGPYQSREVSETLDVEVAGMLPDDKHAAGVLHGEPGSSRALARLPLLRSASALVDDFMKPRESAQIAEPLIEGRAGQPSAIALLAEGAP
ncbi:MAG: chromosome partitioning protein [Chloroflexi bacterium]|nr:MAG: chromosome partitioning protein [Chloroflexota bacterium]